MKGVRLFLACAAVLVFSAAAFANSSADPTIIIKDPVCEGTCTAVGMSFGFGVPASGTGLLMFQNASGTDWFSLRLIETGVAANLINCVQNVFVSCTTGTLKNGSTYIFLSGLANGIPGITNGELFSITLGCARGKCDPWPAGLDFGATANLASATVPEPTTMILMVTGLAGIITRRKWLARA
jgi:hypothetical protein